MKNKRTKLIKIAIIETIGGSGGMTIYDMGVCNGLSSNSCEVHLYTSSETPELEKNRSFHVHRFFSNIYNKNFNKISRFSNFFIGILKINSHTKKVEPDIIYSHLFTFSLAELLLILYLSLKKKKTVINIHDPNSLGRKSNRLIKLFIQNLLKLNTFFLTSHTKYSLDIIQKDFPKKNCSLMPHSDIDIFYSNNKNEFDSKAFLGLDTCYKYILFFGTIKKSKGLDILIKAWSRLFNDFQQYKLLIVGRQWQDGTSDYRKIIENYDVQGSTIWINERIDDDIVNLYFKSSDIVVLPYTEIYSSGVLLRAIGYKKPLIVSDQEAFLEVVDKESAFIFKTGSVSNLTDTLKTSIEDQDLRNKAQLKLTKLIDEKYSWNKIGKVMREYFLWVHENEVNQ